MHQLVGDGRPNHWTDPWSNTAKATKVLPRSWLLLGGVLQKGDNYQGGSHVAQEQACETEEALRVRFCTAPYSHCFYSSYSYSYTSSYSNH